MKTFFLKWNSISLVKRIICGLIVGAILGLAIPGVTGIGILGISVCRCSESNRACTGIFPA